MNIKNPLGIIVLFVTFIDGIAGLVISVNFENLHGAAERLPLIWFIVGFPIFVLVAFMVLVIVKPQNLFGPGDYGNQELYLRAIGKNLIPNQNPQPLKKPEKIPVRRKNSGICMMAIASPHNKPRLSGLKVHEAALQRYADEHDMEIKTEVQMDNGIVCDGVSEKDGNLYLFEVKANYNYAIAGNAIRNLNRISEAMANKGCVIHIVLILVSEKKIPFQILEKLLRKTGGNARDVEIVNYTRDEIEKK